MEIEDGAVRSVSIGFSIPGCEGDSPMGAYFGAPEHFVTDDSVDFTLTGLYVIHANGMFTSESGLSGTLEITPSNPCGQGLSAEWSAVSAELFEPPPAPPELLARIPDIAIPDDLLLPEAGDGNFHEFTQVIDSKGDWFLVSVFDSIFPVPQGWTIFGTGKEDAILVFSRGGIELMGDLIEGITFEPEPEITITIGQGAGDYQTSWAAISAVEDGVAGTPDVTVIGKENVDAETAYILFRLQLETGVERYVLVLVSEFPDDSLRTILAVADGQDWGDYYTVTRAIVENWTSSWDNSRLGVALPDSLLD